MGGGAWPFLDGGAICLLNFDNERDSSMSAKHAVSGIHSNVISLLRGTSSFQPYEAEQ